MIYNTRVIKPPPRKKLETETRAKSAGEKKMIANGWNAHLLWKYLKANDKGFDFTYVHFWRFIKGDSPWPSDELRQRCQDITGAKFSK